MRYKVYSTDNKVAKRRRRIGEFTNEIINFKKTLNTWNSIQTECRLLQA